MPSETLCAPLQRPRRSALCQTPAPLESGLRYAREDNSLFSSQATNVPAANVSVNRSSSPTETPAKASATNGRPPQRASSQNKGNITSRKREFEASAAQSYL